VLRYPSGTLDTPRDSTRLYRRGHQKGYLTAFENVGALIWPRCFARSGVCLSN